MGGGRPFSTGWKKRRLYVREDVQLIQLALECQGHDVGGDDGLIGFRTRIEVGKWQAQNGRAVTCMPDGGPAEGLR